ncbi:MAG: murein biosynthesis integral membrane protein MurJ [bacterium]|nr:murein biosynthesis integral membrane protein MurJ [bacterium]
MSTSKVKKSSLLASAGLVSGATAFSRVFGLIREQTMAYFFGVSAATDAFVTAFRIPNLLRDLFAEGALSSAFVPVFKEKLVNESDQEAFSLARTVATAILLVVGGIVLLGMVATPLIIFISAKGFAADPAKFELTVSLTRLMFVYLLLVSLSALVMGMLNSFGRFGIPAVAPAVFNLGIIFSVVVLYGVLEVPVYALAIGVLVGGVGQLVVQLPSLVKIGFRFRLRFNFLDEGLKRVVKLFMPMVLGMSAGRINIIVNTLLASFLIDGSITYLNYSYRLMHFPLGVFAVALGTVALPRASETAVRGDMDELGRTFSQTLGLNFFVILPSAAFLAMVGPDIVELVYRWGAFSKVDTANTALALLHYSYGLIGFAAVRVTVPIFYALKDSALPAKLSVVSVVLNIALYFPLIEILDFAGLAAATSVAGLVNISLLLYFLPSRKVPVAYGRLFLSFLRMGLAAVLAVGAARFLPVEVTFGDSEVLRRSLNLVFILITSGLLYIVLCFAMRVKEVSVLKSRFFGG